MRLIDTHAHINQPNYKDDLDEMIKRAVDSGVEKIFIPNVDTKSIDSMMKLCQKYKGICYPMMGIHPTSIEADYEKDLVIIEEWLDKEKFVAVGEIGVDLYWEKTFIEQQKKAFAFQIELAKKHNLPVNIHVRNAFDEAFKVLDSIGGSFCGVFHCFSGNKEQAQRVLDYGFYLGVGGVITFKNSGLDNIIKDIDLNRIVLETDAPWLTPAPHRSKRNESSYTLLVAEKIAEIKGMQTEDVGQITTENALKVFSVWE